MQAKYITIKWPAMRLYEPLSTIVPAGALISSNEISLLINTIDRMNFVDGYEFHSIVSAGNEAVFVFKKRSLLSKIILRCIKYLK